MALRMAMTYFPEECEIHCQWAIDQIVRCLAGDGYEEFVALAEAGDDGPATYEWPAGEPG